MTSIIYEMLRKTRQGNTTQQKEKATQYIPPKVGQRKISSAVHASLKIIIQLGFQPMAKNPPYLLTLYVLSQVHLHVHCASLEQFLLCVFIVCEILLSVYTVHISVYIH